MNCFVTGRGGGRGGRREGRGPSKMNVFAITRIRFIRFGLKLASVDILLDPKNKHAEEFFIFLKSKMAAGGQRSKIVQI